MLVVRFFFLFFLFFFSPYLYAQESIRLENGQSYDPSKLSRVFQTLHDEYDNVILFRTILPGAAPADYFILTRKTGQLKAFVYNPITEKLSLKALSNVNLDMIWKNLVQNELFTMKNEKDLANFCALKYHIYDSYTYEFIILSKSDMKVLSYYNPEYYDEVCYGLPERKKVINSASAFSYFWKQN